MAVIADYWGVIFKDIKLTGVARSMPSSGALDRVAAANGLEFHETPTGWKYFSNLLNSGRI